MGEYRTQMKIIGDILSTTRDDLQDEDGATVTYLIRKANISHSRISRILKTLVSQGLLEQADSQGSNRYKISPYPTWKTPNPNATAASNPSNNKSRPW